MLKILAQFRTDIRHFVCAILPIWHTDMAVQHSRLQFDMQWVYTGSLEIILQENTSLCRLGLYMYTL
jgi:hypothetical protein